MDLTICWLYHDLMNTYGDRGNLTALEYRLNARKIKYQINYFSIGSDPNSIKKADLFLMGGAEDAQQERVVADLKGTKQALLKNKLEEGTPGLFICGAYQFLGHYYQTPDNQKLKGLDTAPFITKSPSASQSRLIGNLVVKINHPRLLESPYFQDPEKQILIGFENHGGRSYLEESSALGEVLLGHGNNGQDHEEGLYFQNMVGTYCHGPVLPRNPALADFLIAQALVMKYNHKVPLAPLDDTLELANRRYLLKQLNVAVH